MLPVSFRKVVLSLAFLVTIVAGALQAQTSHYFDQRRFNLGFTMGMCMAHYDMTAQINQFDQATGRVVYNVIQVAKPGIYLG